MTTARIGFLPAALIAVAVAFAGWSVGQGVERFRMADRTVWMRNGRITRTESNPSPLSARDISW